jgi:hypothetical protein
MGDRNYARARVPRLPGGCRLLRIAYKFRWLTPCRTSNRSLRTPDWNFVVFLYALSHVLLLEQFFKHPVVPVFTDFCECALS